jgi:hypothetical protein
MYKKILRLPLAVLSLLLVLLCGKTTSQAAVYSAELDVNLFGYLNQNDIPTIGGFASAPAASVNAYVYLQNIYPNIYGTSLAGTTYNQWIQTAQNLSTANYMATANNGTTFIRDQIYGNVTYLNETVPGLNSFAGQTILADGADWTPQRPQPPYIERVFPTWQSLLIALRQRKAIVIDIFLPGQTPSIRTVTGTSFYWNDIDNNQLIDLSEDAVIDYIDPLDPGTPPDSQGNVRPKRSYGKIFEEILPPGTIGGSRRLNFRFEQPGGSFNSTADAYIASVFYIQEPVPEPSTLAVFALGLSGWCLRFLRQKKFGS